MSEEIGDKLTAYVGTEPIELVVVAIDNDLILYEADSNVWVAGCTPFQVESFFPDFHYDYNKLYFIKYKDFLHDGNSLEYGL